MSEFKYEPIFGDQSLFDNDIGDSVAAINHGDVVFCFNSYNAFLIEVMKCNDLPLSDAPEFAMRRIIKEPKRWTWEDKKAGVLPEVGSLCCDESFTFKVINVTDRYVVIETMKSGDVYSLPHHSFMSSCDPIETPAEKAQREEDVFVGGIVSEYNKMPSPVSFKAGIRAAYRKLKGGESEC